MLETRRLLNHPTLRRNRSVFQIEPVPAGTLFHPFWNAFIQLMPLQEVKRKKEDEEKKRTQRQKKVSREIPLVIFPPCLCIEANIDLAFTLCSTPFSSTTSLFLSFVEQLPLTHSGNLWSFILLLLSSSCDWWLQRRSALFWHAREGGHHCMY